VGREKELKKIQDVFEGSKAGGTVCVKQAIDGLGGVGKTQLALEYADHFGARYSDAIWWVEAEKSPREGLLEFAEEFGLLPEGKDAASQLKDEELSRRLNNWFDRHTSFLLIFDNLETAKAIQPFIKSMKTGHVLITTRNRSLKLANSTSVKLGVFNVDDARAFMLKRLPEEKETQTLDQLIEALGRLPLALEHAAAYMKENNRSCAQYMKLLPQNMRALLGEPGTTLEPEETVAATWQISIEKIQSESAKQLLRLCAWFAPEDIPLSLFIEGRDKLPQPLKDTLAPGNEVEHDTLVCELTRYSLVSFDKRDKSGNPLLSMHRLVQAVVQDSSSELLCCLDMVDAAFRYEYGSKPSMDAFGQSVPHALTIASRAEKAFADEEAQKKISRIYNEAGRGFFCSGQYEEAQNSLQKALAIREKLLGEEHGDTASTYNNIANVCFLQGDYLKAMAWYQKALAIREKLLGEEHPLTADVYHNIANVCSRQGDYAKAMERYQKALAIRKKKLGEEHPDIATTYNNIAVVCLHQGDYAKALESLQKALPIREKALCTEHPDTADTYYNMALVYFSQGKYTEALEWTQKDLAICENVLGKEHPDTATTYGNLALAGFYQEDYTQAMEWFQKVLAIREEVLGKEHPNIATTYYNIARVYYRQGKHDEALEWFGKALAIRKKVLGEKHPDTAAVYHNIARVHSRQGDYTEAMKGFEKALAIRERVLGKEHPDTAITYNSIAKVHFCRTEYVQAMKGFQKALAIRERALGTQHLDTAVTYNNIAKVYFAQGDPVNALALFEKALSIREKVLGKEHRSTANIYSHMAKVYSALGKHAEALEWAGKASAIYKADS
jgi:tetratricopeptide (TPR) repeat protein